MPLIETVNNDTTTFRSFKMFHNTNDVIEVTFDISANARKRYDSGLISFQEMKAHLEVTIKMTEDYAKFNEIMKILES